MRKELGPDAVRRRTGARRVIEVRVGDRFVRWVGAAVARRLCQDRELAARVIPARPALSTAMPPSRELVQSIFGDDLIVLARVDGPRLPVTSVAGLSRQFRRALMAFADQPVAEVISGHRTDGAMAETPHLAVVPLPAVTRPYPDGTLAGIALVLPRDLDDGARGAVMRAIARIEDSHRTGTEERPSIPVLLGDTGILVLQRAAHTTDCAGALRPTTWIGPARRWTSATPIALDRNPGDLHHVDPERRRAALQAAAACVIEAVRRIDLPAPAEVDVLRSCALPGTASPRQYPRFPASPRRLQRVLVHARLRFGEPVRGPILVGAGRFQGLGLLLPDG